MKYKSQLVTQASGSIGGMTGSHNASGLYFRARAIPVNPGTPEQVAVRNGLALAAAAWSNTLTASDRTAWDQYALTFTVKNTLGDPIHMSGINAFIRTRTLQTQASVTPTTTGPSSPGQAALTLPTINTASAANPYTLTFDITNTDDWATTDGGALLVYTSRPQSVGTKYFKGPYQYSGAILGDALSPPVSPQTITSPFNGTLGDKVFWRAIAVNGDGRVSPSVRGTATLS